MSNHAAYVFDLDGVVRDFAPGSPDPVIEAALGLAPGSVAATAFRPELLHPTVTGQQTFDEWYAAVCLALEAAVPETAGSRELVRTHMQRWRDHRGSPVDETVARLEALRVDGHRTYVFTNGTDWIPDELELLGLTRLFDGVINSADLGHKKPDADAYAAAHAVIEGDLGRKVALDDVWFTDDRAENVDAAREFGWDAVLFTRA